MKAFVVFDHYNRESGDVRPSDIEEIYLGVSEDVVKTKVHEDNRKVGGGIDYDELDVKVVCDEEVLNQFDDITLLEELKRRKLVQLEGIKKLIEEVDKTLVKKKLTIPAAAISERQVLEVLRLQDSYYSGMNGDEFKLSLQEYIIKHWNE